MLRQMILAGSALFCCGLWLPAASLAVTPSQQLVERLQSEALSHPADALVRAQLADALLTRARETGDAQLFQESLHQIDAGLALAPTNYLLERTKAEWLLQNGKLPEALILATKLNRSTPDDLMSYSLLVRIHLRQGNIDEAKRQAQWMLDLRQAESISLWRAAEVREAAGENAGALQLFGDAFRALAGDSVFDRALIRAQTARLLQRMGQAQEATRLAAEVRLQFPASTELKALLEGIAQ